MISFPLAIKLLRSISVILFLTLSVCKSVLHKSPHFSSQPLAPFAGEEAIKFVSCVRYREQEGG